MSSGELTNILVSTDVTRYLEFKQVAGSYVQQGTVSRATVAKVPSDAGEALRSPLMGIFEKRRMKSFIEWVGTVDLKDPTTHKGEFEGQLPARGILIRKTERLSCRKGKGRVLCDSLADDGSALNQDLT
jgi:RAB protein geranylgeranyltransferase component A